MSLDLLAEIDRLTKRLDAAHEALTRVEDDDPDEFVSLESTVDWVVTHYRALRKDFDELYEQSRTSDAQRATVATYYTELRKHLWETDQDVPAGQPDRRGCDDRAEHLGHTWYDLDVDNIVWCSGDAR